MTGARRGLYNSVMFGFSLQKLLVLVAVIAAVWYGFKWVSRLQEMRETEQKPAARRPPKAERKAQKAKEPGAEDMVQCPICQAYVPARGASGCGRADCPY